MAENTQDSAASGKLALGAMLKASAAQQMLQGDDISLLAAAKAVKARQEVQKLNKDTAKKIAAAIELARTLNKLDLGGFGLTEIPKEVFELPALKILWLNDNNLTEIPSDISKLENLNQVRLYNNQLTDLPPEIGKLTKLGVLWAQKNELTYLPEEIGDCTMLAVLSVENNQLTKLPISLGQCTMLRELLLEHNELEVPPDWVRAKGMQAQIKYMRRLYVAQKEHILDLRGLQLTEIPKECLEMEDIEDLRLSVSYFHYSITKS
jgi:Leucine-rich repeat (LRR) protein